MSKKDIELKKQGLVMAPHIHPLYISLCAEIVNFL